MSVRLAPRHITVTSSALRPTWPKPTRHLVTLPAYPHTYRPPPARERREPSRLARAQPRLKGRPNKATTTERAPPRHALCGPSRISSAARAHHGPSDRRLLMKPVGKLVQPVLEQAQFLDGPIAQASRTNACSIEDCSESLIVKSQKKKSRWLLNDECSS